MSDRQFSAISKPAGTSLLIPTDHPMSLVSYVLRTKRLDALSYLQKEHPHISSPFISLAVTKPALGQEESAPPTNTLSPQKFRKRIRFKLKISSSNKQPKTDMEFSQLKPKMKLTIKYGKARPINPDQRSVGVTNNARPGSKRGKSKRSYSSSALDFQITT